jgi:hypothetical protein
MRRLYVPLNPAEFTQLQQIAAAERRPVQYQAAMIIAERLSRTELEEAFRPTIERNKQNAHRGQSGERHLPEER